MTETEINEITEEMIAELRKRIGIVWKPRRPYFNTIATADSIRHFCDGIGIKTLFTLMRNTLRRANTVVLLPRPASYIAFTGRLRAEVCLVSTPGIPVMTGSSISRY